MAVAADQVILEMEGKVGTTWRLPTRLDELATTSPAPLALIGHVDGGAEREAEYHRLFAAHHHHGEWFEYAEPVADRIAVDCLIDAWNAASPAAREKFIEMSGGVK